MANEHREVTPAPSEPRPKAFLAWAVEMYGPVAKVRGERLMRFIEEAIELAHADGMERSTLDIIADRVYSRPAGEINMEIGQAQACLETYAENIGESSAEQAEIEWRRVQTVPAEEVRSRHAAKQAIGIALRSPTDARALLDAAPGTLPVVPNSVESKSEVELPYKNPGLDGY